MIEIKAPQNKFFVEDADSVSELHREEYSEGRNGQNSDYRGSAILSQLLPCTSIVYTLDNNTHFVACLR